MEHETMKQAAYKHPHAAQEPYDVLLEQVGFDAVCAFSGMLGGSTVYIPQTRTIFKRCLEIEAVQAFNGGNFPALARKYGFSESHLRRLLYAAGQRK